MPADSTLHYLFAMIRDAIAGQAGSGWAALYAPLATIGKDAGDFPLHCDMYVPQLLWNVFEDVPADGSGAAIFLPIAEMLEIMGELKSLPKSILARIRSCLTTRSEKDRYEWFYDKLHGAHAWTSDLGRRLAQKRLRVQVSRGDGYLLHDRRWLHGRERPKKAVSARRVHRLVFDGEKGTGDDGYLKLARERRIRLTPRS